MATTPNFTGTPKVQSNAVNTLTANIAVDGTGGLTTFFTAGANGSYLDTIFVLPRGSNAASVVRIFMNGALVGELAAPLTTVSQIAPQSPLVLPFKKAIPANAVMSYALGTAVASGFTVTGFGGDY